jgi:hypothetical protein
MPDTALSNTAVPDPGDPQRIESIRIPAIMGMALGLSGLVCMPYRTFFETLGPRATEGAPPFGYWPALFSVAGLLLSVLLVIGSMAAFRLRPRARPLLIAYAIGSLLMGAASLFFYGRHLLPNEGRNLIFRWGGMGLVYELLMWPAAMALAIYLLYVLNRASAKAVFAAGARREAMDKPDR